MKKELFGLAIKAIFELLDVVMLGFLAYLMFKYMFAKTFDPQLFFLSAIAYTLWHISMTLQMFRKVLVIAAKKNKPKA